MPTLRKYFDFLVIEGGEVLIKPQFQILKFLGDLIHDVIIILDRVVKGII